MSETRINQATWLFIALLIVGSTLALLHAFGAAMSPLMPASALVLPWIVGNTGEGPGECNYRLSGPVDVVVGSRTFELYTQQGVAYARKAAKFHRLEVEAHAIGDRAEARECKRLRLEAVQAALMAEEVVS